MKNFKRKINDIKNNIINKILSTKTKINDTIIRIHKIKVNSFLWYLSVILIWGLFISINILNFKTCLSFKYPELDIVIDNTWIIESLNYENTLIPESIDTITSLLTDDIHEKIIENNNIELNSASEKKSSNDESKESVIKNFVFDKIKEIINIPNNNEEIKNKIKEEIKESSKNTIAEPSVKAYISPKNIEFSKNSNNEIVKTEIKENQKNPIIEQVETNSNDQINNDIVNKKIKLLDELNAEIFRWFKNITVRNDNIFLENWVRYSYIYKNYKNFWKWVIPSESDLERGWFDKNSTLLLLDENIWASFVTDYTKVKLISDYIISWVANKHTFLTELIDDKKQLEYETDYLFLSLKNDSIELTNWLSDYNKISKIYDYILKNISYSKQVSLNNKEIFSWIDTFKNKNWICWWYAKLNLYMLSFAWIPDAKVIRWDVLDAPDFPNIGHAWVKIWWLYYDPTFDDPISSSKTKTYNEYKYFWLPEDLFYTNKYAFWTLPSYLKTETLESRKNLIRNNLSKLISKYESKNYILLKPFVFKTKNGLSTDEKITIEKLKNIIPYYEVTDSKYLENNQEKKILKIDYYTIDDSNIEILLNQVDYNLDWLKLFKRDDWKYRLSYNLNIS